MFGNKDHIFNQGICYHRFITVALLRHVVPVPSALVLQEGVGLHKPPQEEDEAVAEEDQVRQAGRQRGRSVRTLCRVHQYSLRLLP
jgi:hypothetical protein